jgi:hypothetical protein
MAAAPASAAPEGIRSVSTTPDAPAPAARKRHEIATTFKSTTRRRTLAPSESAAPPPAGPPEYLDEPAEPGEYAYSSNGETAGEAKVTLLLPADAPSTQRLALKPPAEPYVHPKIEVVRSVERYIDVEPFGGPILTVSIDRKRLAMLNGLFGGASLGMIAHYLVLNALAVHQALPGDGGDESLAAFVTQQERLLLRALIATRLGQTPAPESVAAPLPAFPASLAPRFERCEIETPRSGSVLLVRPFEPGEVRFVERMLANDGAAPFMRAAQLFVGLCAADVAVADDRVRRTAAQALKAYSSLATAEVSRIFLRAKLSPVPDLFKPTDAAFDDAARAVLAELGRAIA